MALVTGLGVLGRKVGLYIGVFAAVAAVYSLTLAPSLTWAHWGSDGGDFVTAAATGRVPHPPGFPIYTFLSRVVVLIGPEDPARKLNVLSAGCAVGATLLVALTVRKRRGSAWAALVAAMALAFSSWFWSQALITEVYTMAALFGSFALYAVHCACMRRFLPWAVVGLSLGLGVSTHLTVLFLLPFTVFGRQVHWRGLAVGLCVGLAPYAMLPLRGPWPQPWGDLRTLAGWAEYVSARMYWGNAFALPLADWPARVLAWASLMARQLTPLGALVALAGASRAWSTNRLSTMGGAVTLALASLYAIGYSAPDSWVYIVAYMPIVALTLGDGIQWLADRDQRAAVAGLVIPVLLVALNWQAMTLVNEVEAVAWLEATLDALPNGAVVVANQDRHTFALWYATEATARRPDISVVDQRLWGYGPYNGFLGAAPGDSANSLELWAGNRPFCRIDEHDEVICQ